MAKATTVFGLTLGGSSITARLLQILTFEEIAFLKVAPSANAIIPAVIEAYFWRVGKDPCSLNRQGGSGEFVNELRSEIIMSLNGLFASQLAILNYERVPQTSAQRYRALASNKAVPSHCFVLSKTGNR